MSIQILRNENGNCINFRGSSAPVYYNACLSGEVDPDDNTLVNVINDIATNSSPDKVYVFYQIPYTEWRDADNNPFANAQDVADYITLVGNVATGTDVAAGYQGVWDASTNTPDVANTSPSNGDWYYVSVAGNYEPNGFGDSSSSSTAYYGSSSSATGSNAYNVNDIIKYDENSGLWQLIRNETVRVDQLQQEVEEIVYSTESALFNTNASIYADGDQATSDPNNAESGWYYKNLDSSSAGKINWYYVGNVNPQNTMTLGTMKSMYAVIKVVATGVPHFTLYTQPTGGAADADVWYRSRLNYTGAEGVIDSYVGQQVLLYWGEDPSDKFLTIPHIELTLDESTSNGPQSSDENVLFGALATSSNSPEGTYEFIAKTLGFKNNTHITEYLLDTNDPVNVVTSTDVGSNQAIDFTRDATNTSVLFSHTGASQGVNTIIAVLEDDGTISIKGVGDDDGEIVEYITNLNHSNVTITGSAPASQTPAGVVNALNALFTVNPLGAGYEPATILPTLAGAATTLNFAEGATPITGTPTHLYTTDADTSSGHGARVWTDETIDAAGEFFDVKITGGSGSKWILGLVNQDDTTTFNELTNDTGNGNNGLTWGNAFYDYGSYNAPWTTYGRGQNGVSMGLSYGPGWNGSTDSQMRYNTEVQDNLDNMDDVLFRVGINDQGYIYVSYYDAGRTNDFIVTARTSKVAQAGNWGLVVKLWSGNATLVEGPTRSAVDPVAPALTYRYIESPDGSFHYPLFATEEEANYVDTANGGGGTSHTHVYVDEPTNSTWYMPDTGGQMAVSSAPSDTSEITYTVIPTNADEQYAPAAFSGIDYTVNENTAVNIQVAAQDVNYTTTISGLPDGLSFDGLYLISGTTSYVPEDTTYTITVTRTNAYGSSAGSFDLTISDNISLGDLTGFTEVSGNFAQPNRMLLDFDALLQYDTVLSQGQELTYSFSSGNIPPTIGILSTTGQDRVDDFDSTTHTLGSGSHDFSETAKWDLRFVTFGGYVGGSDTKHNLVGWDDNTVVTGTNENLDVEFKLEYANDGYIRLYRNGVLLKTSASTFTGDQTITLAGFDDQQQTDLYIPTNFTITTTGAGSTTPPTGFEDPLLEGEMGSTTLLGNPDDSVNDAAVQLTEQLKVNHRFIFPQTWVESNVLPYVQDDGNDVFVGVPKPSVDWSDVGTADFDVMFKFEGTTGTSHISKIKQDLASGDSYTINSLTDAFYDYALEWDGEDLHVIACNIGDINTQPGISDGGTFSRVMTYSGYGTATGTTGQPLDIAIAVDDGGQVALTTSGLQQIRIPFGARTILVGESSSGNGQFGQVSSTYFDLGGQHAPGALTFNAPTVNAGYTYTFIYHPSMEATDFIEFRLASDNTTVYTTGVTTFDNTTGGDPAYTDRYKGVTFAVPSDAPPLRVYHYNSYQSGYYDAGRDLPISGSTYVTPVTGITLEGPAVNQTGSNLFNDPAVDADGVVWGWLSIDEQLASGERLVLDNAFLIDLTDAMPDNSAIMFGLKSDTWSNNLRNNSIANATFAGARFEIYRYSSADIRFVGRITGASSIGINVGTNGVLNNGVELAFEITNSGNNIRMLLGTNSNSSDDVNTTAYADWNSSYKTQTGDQGYGLTSRDIIFLGDGNVTGAGGSAASGEMDSADVDWTGLSEIIVPTPATTLTTNWTKALDFSGSSERTTMVNNSSLYSPIKMDGINNNVAAPTTTGYTSNDSNSRPWATAIVFSSDNNSSNQHVWNLGEGTGSTDDNIYLRVDANRNMWFGWGRTGEINECYIETLSSTAGTWYGVYIASTGERVGGSHTASDIADCFDIRIINLSTGTVGINQSTSSNWTSGSFGGRMNREFTGEMTIGGRGANRNFHGKVAAMVVTTLRTNVAMPTDAEISMMVRDPIQWLTDYKVGNAYRLPTNNADSTPFTLGTYNSLHSTHVWLMGDGPGDAYAQIRNYVWSANQNRTAINMVSMVSSDIETVNISGLT